MDTHMSFFIGKGSENLILYLVDLVIVFTLSLVVEWLSHTTFLSNYSDEHSVKAGLLQTGLYGVRMTVAYVVMLAVMSFDAGILCAAVAGFSAGFLVYGSRLFEMGYHQPSDLPPLNC